MIFFTGQYFCFFLLFWGTVPVSSSELTGLEERAYWYIQQTSSTVSVLAMIESVWYRFSIEIVKLKYIVRPEWPAKCGRLNKEREVRKQGGSLTWTDRGRTWLPFVLLVLGHLDQPTLPSFFGAQASDEVDLAFSRDRLFVGCQNRPMKIK